MGIIRFLLAVCVVMNHMPFSAPHFFDSELAVRSFFVISGFYMALILNEKYSLYSMFLTNRLLRLYPIYFVVLLITFIFVLFNHHFIYPTFWEILNPFSFIFIVLANLIILGQDIIMFMGVNYSNGTLFFTANWHNIDLPLYQYLIVPQAWSISIELMFYAIAPFIVKRNPGWIILIIITSTLFRLGMGAIGHNNDPWGYRFFPFELTSFSFGILSYSIYRKIKNYNINKILTLILYFFFLVYTFGFEYIPAIFSREAAVLYPIVLALGIPFIFLHFKSNKWDKYIGELSYPIYICHMLILCLINNYAFEYLNPPYKSMTWLIAISATIISSIILFKFISEPIDRYRQSRVVALQ